jgi:O-antigen ligase
LAGVTVVFILIVGVETTWARLYSEGLTAGRVQFAKSTLHMIAVHPLIGWGLGCWPAVYPAFATFDPGAIVNQAHSDWLQWTAEGGVPVGLAMLSLAVWAVRPATRSIWGGGVIAVLIHAAFDYPFSRPAVGAWPILILSMVATSATLPQIPANAQGFRRGEMEKYG